MTDNPDPAPGERVAKALARAGVASRREAERLIADGRISVNGTTLTTPAVKIGPGDDLRFDGEPVAPPPPTRLWRYHKPEGLLTTHHDPEGRETVFDRLPEDMGRVISVGRLDLNSTGLLLLTNDGALARALELPSTAWARRYRVRAYGDVSEAALSDLKNGITVEGVKYGSIDASLDRRTGANVWLTVTLREGKNREIRKVLSALGLQVNRLMRVAYGPFQLGALKEGAVEEVKLSVLRDQLGKNYPLDLDGYPTDAPVRAPVKPEDGAPRKKPAGDRSGWAKPKRPEREKPKTVSKRKAEQRAKAAKAGSRDDWTRPGDLRAGKGPDASNKPKPAGKGPKPGGRGADRRRKP